MSIALFGKGQMHWKPGDSLDNDCFQNWLPGLLELNTDVQTWAFFFLKVLLCRRICVTVWEEKIKGKNEGNETSPLKNFPAYSLEVE